MRRKPTEEPVITFGFLGRVRFEQKLAEKKAVQVAPFDYRQKPAPHLSAETGPGDAAFLLLTECIAGAYVQGYDDNGRWDGILWAAGYPRSPAFYEGVLTFVRNLYWSDLMNEEERRWQVAKRVEADGPVRLPQGNGGDLDRGRRKKRKRGAKGKG